LTSIFFDYGGANQVELVSGIVVLHLGTRNSFPYPLNSDNSIWQIAGGKADRQWTVEKGGPVSVDDLAKLKNLVDATDQIHFRGPITSNADVHVLVLSLQGQLGTEGLPSAGTTTKCVYINAVLREAV
jgi:hypothetical protein